MPSLLQRLRPIRRRYQVAAALGILAALWVVWRLALAPTMVLWAVRANAYIPDADPWALRTLILLGAPVDFRFGERRDTPLVEAGFSLETAKLLLDAGADINAVNDQGSTPLGFRDSDLAREGGDPVLDPLMREIIAYYVSRGAKRNNDPALPAHKRTRVHMGQLCQVVQSYRSSRDSHANSIDPILAFQQVRPDDAVLYDSWGNRLLYGRYGRGFVIQSVGPDHKRDTRDDLWLRKSR